MSIHIVNYMQIIYTNMIYVYKNFTNLRNLRYTNSSFIYTEMPKYCSLCDYYSKEFKSALNLIGLKK